MSTRMAQMRRGLHDKMRERNNPHKWNHIED